MQAVGACREPLPLDADIMGKRDGGIIVGSCPPYPSIWNDGSKNGTPFYTGTVIGNSDVCDADPLHYLRLLADRGEIQQITLRRGGGPEQEMNKK